MTQEFLNSSLKNKIKIKKINHNNNNNNNNKYFILMNIHEQIFLKIYILNYI